MIDRTTRLRWRRWFRRGKRQVEEVGMEAQENLDKHLIGRLSRLVGVRRFVFGWLALASLLITGLIIQTRGLGQYYLTLQPTPGGIYKEGIVGVFTNANPLYATGSVNSSVSKLLFSGLLKYDQNNQLTGDLAESWTPDEREITYTIKLRPNLKWHDGQPLTAQDVLYTYRAIQNPDARSPLITSWQGISVEAPDDQTVIFRLPSSLSAFPNFLTNGITPKHILENTSMGQLRSLAFNTTNPVGSGPFKWQAIEVTGGESAEREQRIGLTPYSDYHLGKAKLNQFVIHTYPDEKRLIDGLKSKQVQGIAGLVATPDDILNDKTIEQFSVPLTSAVYAFFKNSQEPLSDSNFRRALVLAANNKALVEALGFPVILSDEPLLKRHVGYDPALAQAGHNLEEANRLFDSLGFTKDPTTGIRGKEGKPLNLRLFSQNTVEYTAVTQSLQNQWRAAGVDVQVILEPEDELQAVIANHEYDILLYGISLGNDPDVFAYWHSSQADIRSANRLNFSEYKSPAADRALEAGRTRSDAAIKAVKYKPFLEAWRAENPALALYEPRFLYLVREPLFNFEPARINVGAERFNNVHNWMIRQKLAPEK